MSRTLCEIATEIRLSWGKNLSHEALPWLASMDYISNIHDNMLTHTGYEIVQNFLANAGGWRSVDARRIKAELKQHLQGNA